MAKLTRYLQKIFANNSNQVGVFGTGVDKETSKNVETLQSADYENGWSSAIITNKNYPIWQEMDGVQYGLSYQLKYLFQNGIPEWLSTETYYANTSFCQYGGKIYQSLQDNNTNHNPALDNGWWTPLLTSNRSIGEIIPSTIPLTEAGLHLLDGALITNAMYSDFVTYMANLTATAPNCFCTEAEWQQSVTNYGACGKFVYDSVNNTVRLPKITGIIEGTNTASNLGDLVKAGLPDITILGATGIGQIINYSASGGSIEANANISLSNYNPIYGNSNTVQPQTIKVLYYIVIATSTKTNIQVDIDEIATDLNGKADVDLTNVNDTGTSTGAGWAMPSDTYVDLTLGASDTNYTAPANGWVCFVKGGSSGQYISLKGEGAELEVTASLASNSNAVGIIYPVYKNQIFKATYSTNGTTWQFRFYYAQGSESEAS